MRSVVVVELKRGKRKRGEGQTCSWVCNKDGVFRIDDDGQVLFSCTEGEAMIALLRSANLVEGKKIRVVGCSTHHVIALCEYGKVYTCAQSNDYFETGRRTNWDVLGVVEELRGEFVKDVTVGEWHNVAVTISNHVFTWGRCDYGQLGWKPRNPSEKTLVGRVQGSFSGIVQSVATGALHTGIVVDYTLFTFGWGLYGQLGHGDSSNQDLPKCVQSLTGIGRMRRKGGFEDIKQVSCGNWHTAVVSVPGDVYIFGWNKHGQVSYMEEHQGQSFKVPKLLSWCDDAVVQVSCGALHTACRTREGYVFALGTLWNPSREDEEQMCKFAMGHMKSAKFVRLKLPSWLVRQSDGAKIGCDRIESGDYFVACSRNRTRSFEHVDGNWPTLVYLKIGQDTEQYALKAMEFLRGETPQGADITKIDHSEAHISLTKPFTLRYHQIESFTDDLRIACNDLPSFVVRLEEEPIVLENDEKTRMFASFRITAGKESVLQLIDKVNTVMSQYQKPVYYENPIPHVSLAWTTSMGTKRCSKAVSALKNLYDSDDEVQDDLPQIQWKVTHVHIRTGHFEYAATLAPGL